MKKIFLLLMILICIGFVNAWSLQTILNPYTGKMDYIGISNQTNSVYVVTNYVSNGLNTTTNITTYNVTWITVNSSNTFNGNQVFNGNTTYGPSYILQYINQSYNATSGNYTYTIINVTMNSTVTYNAPVVFNKQTNFTNTTFFNVVYIVTATISNTVAITPTATPPSLVQSTGVVLYSEDRGEESMLAMNGKNGYNVYLSYNTAYDDVAWYQPAHTTTGTTAPVMSGMTVTAPVGTVSNPAKSYGNFRDTMTWAVLTSAAGLDELKNGGMNWGRGNSSITQLNGGYKLVMVYNVQLADANTTGCFGMTDSVTPYTNVSNCIRGALSTNSIWAGFTQTVNGTNLSYYSTNATAGALNKLYDCGANYPIGNITSGYTAVYETTIFAKQNGGNVSFYTKRLDNTSIEPCSFSIVGNDGRLPLSTVPQSWRLFLGRDNVAPGTTGVVMGMNKVFIASDN